MHVVRLLAPALASEDYWKDIDFSAAGICALAGAGRSDGRHGGAQAVRPHPRRARARVVALDRRRFSPSHQRRKGLRVIYQRILILAALSVFAVPVLAQAKKGEHGAPSPCKAVEQACKNAGFIQGDWKKGDGLWRDCVDPIMQGQTNVPGATKPLPTVDAKAVAQCKAEHPKFGAGKVGSTKK
jgi:hypothetical protein